MIISESGGIINVQNKGKMLKNKDGDILNIYELNPFVRYFDKRIGETDYPHRICAFDYRLFYVRRGNIKFVFKDKELSVDAGGVITIPPGVGYKLKFLSKSEFYIMNFDFTSAKIGINGKMPVEENKFNKNEIFSLDSIPPFEKIFALNNCQELDLIFEKMYSINSGSPEQIILNSALMKLAIAQILILKESKSVDDKTIYFIKKVKNFINENINDSLNNVSVAKHFGYHPYYLNDVFVKAEGITLHKYITCAKIKNIKSKLAMTDFPIFEIAIECGFKDSSYFSHFFRKATGLSPNEYRKLLK